MLRRALIPACLALIAACGDGVPVEPPLAPPIPPPPTFVVSGIVETAEGTPLAGALVELFAPGPLLLESTTTGPDGFFAFDGVHGYFLLRVTRIGYLRQSLTLNVTEDHLYRFQLAPWPEADVLTLGDWIRASVIDEAPPCDPVHWDEYAPCHRFVFSPATDGKLVITLEWVANQMLDVTLVTPDGVYIATSEQAGFGRARLEGLVLKDQLYEVRVNSYYGAQDFRLRAELVP